MKININIAVIQKRFIDEIAFHCKKPDLTIQSKTINHHARTKLLKIPNHFIKGEGNLLLGFEAYNFSYFAFFNRGQFDKAGQTTLA